MKQIFDMHCHSSFSEDSQADIDEMCKSAINKGINGIAFTEHVDFNPSDSGFEYLNEQDYLREIERLQKKYKKKLKIFKGMEFGETHLYPDKLLSMSRNNYDVIIGSVHMLGDTFVGDPSILNKYTYDELFTEYYTIMLDMVKYGGFDILGHFDFPKRYYSYKYTNRDLTDAILLELIKKDIALEINTSPLRKSCIESSPDLEILSRYAQLGGKRITIGSDAHIPEDIQSDFDYAYNLIAHEDSLIPGYFEQREFKAI